MEINDAQLQLMKFNLDCLTTDEYGVNAFPIIVLIGKRK